MSAHQLAHKMTASALRDFDRNLKTSNLSQAGLQIKEIWKAMPSWHVEYVVPHVYERLGGIPCPFWFGVPPGSIAPSNMLNSSRIGSTPWNDGAL